MIQEFKFVGLEAIEEIELKYNAAGIAACCNS